MIKPRIILTGATGNTGSVVVSEFAEGPAIPSVAQVRREDGRSAGLEAQGAEIAVADALKSAVPGRDTARLAVTRRSRSTGFPGETL